MEPVKYAAERANPLVRGGFARLTGAEAAP
jgi:hypothetical protein